MPLACGVGEGQTDQPGPGKASHDLYWARQESGRKAARPRGTACLRAARGVLRDERGCSTISSPAGPWLEPLPGPWRSGSARAWRSTVPALGCGPDRRRPRAAPWVHKEILTAAEVRVVGGGPTASPFGAAAGGCGVPPGPRRHRRDPLASGTGWATRAPAVGQTRPNRLQARRIGR